MYLLDTNHYSRIVNGDAGILQRLKEHSDSIVATSVITQGELIFMAQKSQQKLANTARIEGFLRSIRTIPVDAATATIYGHVKASVLDKYGPKDRSQLRRATTNQLGFGENDLWIAALSIQHGLTLVTSDSDFQRVHAAEPLLLESWLAPHKPLY